MSCAKEQRVDTSKQIPPNIHYNKVKSTEGHFHENSPVTYPESLSTTNSHDDINSISQNSLSFGASQYSSVTSLSVSQVMNESIDSDGEGLSERGGLKHKDEGDTSTTTDISEWDDHTESELHIILEEEEEKERVKADEIKRRKEEEDERIKQETDLTISQVIWKRSIMFGPDDSSDDEEENFSEEEDENMIKNSESSSSSSDIMLDQSTTTTTSYSTVVMAEEQQNDEEDGDQKTIEKNTQLASLTIKDPLEINTEVIRNEELISSTLSEALADIETNDSQDENVHDEVTTSDDTTLGNKDESDIISRIQQGNDSWDTVNNDKTISGIDSKHSWLKRERELQMKEIQTVEKEMKSSEELNMEKCLVVNDEKSGKKQTKLIIENGSTVQCDSENIAIPLSNTKMSSLDEVIYKKKEDGLKEGDDNISTSSDMSIYGSSIQLLEYNSSTENTSDSKSSSGDLLVTSSTNTLVSSSVYVRIQNPDSTQLIDKEDHPKELLDPKSSSIICNNLATDTNEILEVLTTEKALKLVLQKLHDVQTQQRLNIQEFEKERNDWKTAFAEQAKIIATLRTTIENDKKKMLNSHKRHQERTELIENAIIELGRHYTGQYQPLLGVKKQRKSSVSQHQAEKLKKFFGTQPPLLLHQFLKDLGYEEYIPRFHNEKIGILELPYLTEHDLINMGLPLGPRLRILHEAKQL